MVPPLGIEPSSTMLQTVAMTTSAKAANLIGEMYGNRTHINGITIRGVNLYTNNSMVVIVRVELTLDSV
jgi:hypothetical protein